MIEPYRFFDFGKVTIINYDEKSRQTALDVCIPCCLLLAINSAILKHSVIDNYRIRNPLVTWTPRIDSSRLKSEHAHSHFEVNEVLKSKMLHILTVLTNLTSILNEPSDITPMLPMGTYVEFRIRCTIDNILNIIQEIEKINIVGIPEFKFALAEVLASLLHETGDLKKE